MAERARLRDVARGRKVPVNTPQQAPATTTVVSAATPAAGGAPKRVQATLDGTHPMTEKTTEAPAKESPQDVSANAA